MASNTPKSPKIGGETECIPASVGKPSPPKYRTLVADPPWEYKDPFGGFNAGGKGAMVRRPLPYPSLSVDEICDLSVEDVAEDDSNLFLWTTNRHLPEAFRVVKAWGFEYRQMLVWHKTGARPNSGSIAPTSCEFILFARRGAAVATDRFPDALITTKRVVNAHSRKPEVFLDLVESVSPPPYLELFARRQRLGWDTWGNEAIEHVQLPETRRGAGMIVERRKRPSLVIE